MKKYLCIVFPLVLAVSLLMVPAAPVGATSGTVTFVFHASDFLNITPGELGEISTDAEHSYQANARQLRDRTGTKWQYNTFNGEERYNAYQNWRDGLGEGEGISAFNMWLLDEVYAPTWGETTVREPGTPITATCPEGWAYRIVESAYGIGSLIEWFTTNPAYYLRPGEDPGVFSFTADVYKDVGSEGWDIEDPPVEVGDICRIWFGCSLNDTDDPPFKPGFVFDAEGWGDLEPAMVDGSPGVFASSDYTASGGPNQGELLQFDATLDLEATGSAVVFTATPPDEIIGISVVPSAIDFGAITGGAIVDGVPLTVTNLGNVSTAVDAEVKTDTTYDTTFFYTKALRLNTAPSDRETDPTAYGSWTATDLGLTSIAPGGSESVTTGLECPSNIKPGITYTGSILFVATME